MTPTITTRAIAAALALTVTASAANATCTRKSLNGTWSFSVVGQLGVIGKMSGGTYIATVNGSLVTFTLTSFNSTTCKGSGLGSIGGTQVSLKGSTEQISTSKGRPNHFLMTMQMGTTAYEVIMQRQ